MTNDTAIRDDLKSMERWENEGGKVSPLNNVWAKLKSFERERNSREVSDSQKSFTHQH